MTARPPGARRGGDALGPQTPEPGPATQDGGEARNLLRVVIPRVTLHESVRQFKRHLIEATLEESGGNRSEAARRLGIQRTYLHRLMRELEIHVPVGGARPGRGTDLVRRAQAQGLETPLRGNNG